MAPPIPSITMRVSLKNSSIIIRSMKSFSRSEKGKEHLDLSKLATQIIIDWIPRLKGFRHYLIRIKTRTPQTQDRLGAAKMRSSKQPSKTMRYSTKYQRVLLHLCRSSNHLLALTDSQTGTQKMKSILHNVKSCLRTISPCSLLRIRGLEI